MHAKCIFSKICQIAFDVRTMSTMEVIFPNTNWGNHVSKVSQVFNTPNRTPIEVFKPLFCPNIDGKLHIDARMNRKRVNEVTELRRVCKNVLMQLKYANLREQKTRQCLMVFAGYGSHFHHHLAQIQGAVLQNPQVFTEQIVQHCEYLHDKLSIYQDSALQ